MKTRVPTSSATSAELLKIPEAARRMGISYPTLKQWIYKGKIRCAQTPGGHYRIADSEIRRLMPTTSTPAKAQRHPERPANLDAMSMRNKLLGTILDVQIDGLLAQVTLDVGGQIMTSIITRDGCLALGLKKGMSAYATVKSTEVSIIRA